MNVTGKDALGLEGEDAAARFLAGKGCRVLARRWRAGRAGEIDLVVQDGPEVVFVEVKTRRGAAFGPPEEAVTRAKRARLRTAAGVYLAATGIMHGRYRIDVIAVTLGGGEPRIDHFVAAVGEED